MTGVFFLNIVFLVYFLVLDGCATPLPVNGSIFSNATILSSAPGDSATQSANAISLGSRRVTIRKYTPDYYYVLPVKISLRDVHEAIESLTSAIEHQGRPDSPFLDAWHTAHSTQQRLLVGMAGSRRGDVDPLTESQAIWVLEEIQAECGSLLQEHRTTVRPITWRVYDERDRLLARGVFGLRWPSTPRPAGRLPRPINQ